VAGGAGRRSAAGHAANAGRKIEIKDDVVVGSFLPDDVAFERYAAVPRSFERVAKVRDRCHIV
jgi:hypothetical protein